MSSLPSWGWIERLVRYQKVGTFRHYINLGGLPTQHYGMCPDGIRIGTSTEFGWCDWFRIYPRHSCCRRSSTSVSKSWWAGDAAAPRSLVCIYTYGCFFSGLILRCPGIYCQNSPPLLPGSPAPPLITFFFFFLAPLFSALGMLGGDDSSFGRLQEESKKKQKSQIIYLVTYRV